MSTDMHYHLHKEAHPAGILHGLVKKQKNQNEFFIHRNHIVTACARLRKKGYEHITLLTGIDWQDRWEVVYHIVGYGTAEPVVLRVELPREEPVVPSIVSVWPGAGWHERETWDLLGIKFAGNPDLRRILLPEDYEGHPLRKEVKFGNKS